jgi:hypothetical protein
MRKSGLLLQSTLTGTFHGVRLLDEHLLVQCRDVDVATQSTNVPVSILTHSTACVKVYNYKYTTS